MKKSNFKEKLSKLKSTPPPKVKKSYYTFSKEYPAGNIPIKRRKHKKVKSSFVKYALYVSLFLVLMCASYFVMDLALEISYKEPEITESTEVQETETPNLLASDGVRALYMPSQYLVDEEYIGELIKEIRKKNGNSVVIDFKTAEGKLNYSSMQEYAISGKCSVFDNDTVRKAVNIFTSNGITIIGRVYCFEDSVVPTVNENLAVKYMDTDVNWLDGSDEEGGKPWLNPCAKKNHNYLTGILEELYNLGVKGFILESCQFPEGETSGATYPGEKNFKSKNSALKSFIKKARKALPEDAFLLLGLSATDAAKNNDSIYFGSMSGSSADGIAAYISERSPEYVIDKTTAFSSMLSLYSDISDNNKDKAFIPVVETEEYSRSFFSSMNKAGYQNYILFSEKGEY